MSEFGLIEMTRQRNRESLIQTLYTDCPYCAGKGMIKNMESTSIELERSLKDLIQGQQYALDIVIHPALDRYLEESDKKFFEKLAQKLNASLTFRVSDSLHLNVFEIYSSLNGKRLDS